MKSSLRPLLGKHLDLLKPLYKKMAKGIASDSRQIRLGDLFLAYPGAQFDGRDYIPDAIANGASCVFWDPRDGFSWSKKWCVPNQAVANLSQFAGLIAADMFDYPSNSMHLVGITGTNGKTSIAHWLAQSYNFLQQKSAVIGTLGNGLLHQLAVSTHTTPDAISLQRLIAAYRKESIRKLFIEVSSHALDQGRVNGIPFATAIFSNLTRDHLDYHLNMRAYGEAKKLLFYWETLKNAIINIDDPFGKKLADALKHEKMHVLTYGLKKGDVHTTSCQVSREGLCVDITTPWGVIQLRNGLIGRFNVANVLATLSALCLDNIPIETAKHALASIKPVCGRMQHVGGGHQPLVIIDYAHTPDALEKTLIALSELCEGNSKLFCVFGCGGNRDKGKRPLMGEIAEKIAQVTVITSDNPRCEDPNDIVKDIVNGMKAPSHIEVDRTFAIHWAISSAKSEDIVLIAGKGHETCQVIGDQKMPFSDYEVAREALKKRSQI